MILSAESCPRLVRGYYVAIAWLVPVWYEGGPRLPRQMAIFARFQAAHTPETISIAYFTLPPGLLEWLAYGNVNADLCTSLFIVDAKRGFSIEIDGIRGFH